MKIVTFNIKIQDARDQENQFYVRYPSIVRKIREETPDIIGVQEMNETMEMLLRAALPEYDFLGAGREAGLKGERTSILCRRETITPYGYRMFWLSDTPDVIGSRYGEQGHWPRICVAASIRHNQTGALMRIYNTHLDHKSDTARTKGLQLILKTIAQDQAGERLPVFLTGDMNFMPDKEQYKLFSDPSLYPMRVLTEGLKSTCNHFNIKVWDEPIDYILTNAALPDFKISQWHNNEKGMPYSDHDAICAEFEIPGEGLTLET